MDGVLEATITLCGCKVLFSILCLPAFKDSISSVSFCCICLLLFTDLSITMFLAYLWCASPRPMSFHPSSDVIALRFMLFLSETYEAVLMLTPLLVTVELLVRLLWDRETMTSSADEEDAKEHKDGLAVFSMDIDGDTWVIGPQQKGEEKENNGMFFKALGFIGCLMLWFMCGTYAGCSWRQEQVTVRSCLERGSLLSTCLPCLLTASSPVSGQLFWALLALTAVLSLLVAKLPTRFVQPEEPKSEENSDALQVMQTHQPTPERTLNPAASVLHNCIVDSEKTENSCAIHSLHNKRRWAHGNPEPLSWRKEQADSCKLKSESITLVLRPRCTGPHPHKSWFWQTLRESPCLREELMTGLLCGLLVCIFPTFLSTNILLVSNLDTLAVYIVKHLLTPLHSK